MNLRHLFYCILISITVIGFEAQGSFFAKEVSLDQGRELIASGPQSWADVPTYQDFFEYKSSAGKIESYRTIAQFAFNEESIYIRLEGMDSDIDSIRSELSRRDKIAADQDFFSIYLSSSGSGGVAQIFRINPQGILTDGIQTSKGEDLLPDFEFEGHTVLTNKSWVAYIRIPFSSVLYSKEYQNWSMLVIRNIPRRNNLKTASSKIPIGSNCLVCHLEKIEGISNLKHRVWARATPHATFRHASFISSDRKPTSGYKAEFGIDAKIKPISALSLDLTIKPDYSHLELDAPTLTSSQFSNQTPEKRTFFLEGADMFESPINVIQTRSITNPAWGVRATLRQDTTDITLLTGMDNGQGKVLIPSAYGNDALSQDFRSKYIIGRYHKRINNWKLGGLLTSRDLEDDRGYNRVAGLDLAWQLKSGELYRWQVLRSMTTASPSNSRRLELGSLVSSNAVYFDWWKPTARWSSYFQIRNIGDGFRADNGYLPQNAVRSYYVELTGKQNVESKNFREINTHFNMDYVQDKEGNEIFINPCPGISTTGLYSSIFRIDLCPEERTRLEPGKAKEFTRRYFKLYGESSLSSSLPVLKSSLEIGDQIDFESESQGKGGQFSISGTLRPLRSIEIKSKFQSYWISSYLSSLNKRNYQTEAIWHLDNIQNIRLILQGNEYKRTTGSGANNSKRKSIFSLLYSLSPSFGSSLYIGATHERVSDEKIYAPQNRTEYFVKGLWSF